MVSAIAVDVNLANALRAVIGAGPVTRKQHLVFLGVGHPVVATAGHGALALRNEKAAGHGVVVVDAFVIRVHVVNVVHDVGHADGQPCPVVVVVRGGGHQPRARDDGG